MITGHVAVSASRSRIHRPLVGGLLALAVAMGIGRFAYTPLLPVMQAQLHWSVAYAGFLASINYAGYFVGAMTAQWLPKWPGWHRLTWIRVGLVAVSLATALMGLTDGVVWWALWRGMAGLFSGWVLVLSASLVLDWLAAQGALSRSGLFYMGIGLGIAVTGVVVPFWTHAGAWRQGWIGLGIVALVLSTGASWLMAPLRPVESGTAPAMAEPAAPGFAIWGLAVAYGLEGLGYIVMATFVTEFFDSLSGNVWMGDVSWVVVGLAAAPSALAWTWVARRWGWQNATYAAFLTQATGILLPVMWTGVVPAVLGSLFFGGTFIGIMTLVLSLGRMSFPHHSARVIAYLTAVFGIGQMLGPAAAGALTAATHQFGETLLLSGLVVLAGAVVLRMAAPPSPAHAG